MKSETEKPMSETIELIVVDLDGTLLNSEHKMTEKSERALKAAMEKGARVVIATGKTRYAAREIIERLNLDTPGIYVQGLTIYTPEGTVKQQWTLDPAVARQVITFCEDRGFDMMAYSGDRLLIKQPYKLADELNAKYHEPAPEAIGPLQNILDDMPINKLIAVRPGDFRKITALRWQLGMQLDGRGRLVQAMIKDMLEILPPAGSKGTALKAVLKDMGIKPENVLAIGDGENDIEMLQLAGVAVAVGNADERLKAVADHVVASNDAEGVAEAIERFVLGGKLDAPPAAATPATLTDPEIPAADGPRPLPTADSATTETETTQADAPQAEATPPATPASAPDAETNDQSKNRDTTDTEVKSE